MNKTNQIDQTNQMKVEGKVKENPINQSNSINSINQEKVEINSPELSSQFVIFGE